MSRDMVLILLSVTSVCVAVIAGFKVRKAPGPTVEVVASDTTQPAEAASSSEPTTGTPTESVFPRTVSETGATRPPRATSGNNPVIVRPVEPAAEVKRFAVTLAALRLATNEVERLTPPEPKALPDLDLTRQQVGDRGHINVACEILQVEDGMLLVSPLKQGDYSNGKAFAVAGLDTATKATGQEVGLDGDFEAFRTAKFGTVTAVVFRKLVAPETRDPNRTALLDLAQTQKRQAEATHEESRRKLKEARDSAVARAVAGAREDARRRFPVPKDGRVEDRIKAQRNLDEAMSRLVKAAKDDVEARYAEPK